MTGLKFARLSYAFFAALSFLALSSNRLEAQTFAQVPSLSFTKVFAGADPLPQIVTVASTGAPLTYSVAASSTGGWLSVSPAGYLVTPSSITAKVTTSPTMAVGSYPGQIVVTEYGGSVSFTISVTLTVSSPSTSFLDNMPGQMSFWLKTGNTTLSSQFIQVRNGGTGSLNWNLTTSTSDGGNWLTTNVSSGTAPTTVTVGVNVALLPSGGLIAGTFVGQLVFSGGGTTTTVPVVVSVGGTTALTNIFSQVSPINFTTVFGGAAPLPQILTMASIGTASLTYSISVSTASGGAWLTVGPAGYLTTPSAFTVTPNPIATLAVGSYTAQVLVTPYGNGGASMVIPVTLTVAPSGGTYLDNLQGQLSFSMIKAGTSITSQFLQVRDGGSGTLSWSVTSSTADAGPWLTVSQTSGTAPATITVGVTVANLPNGGLIEGTFIGELVFTGNGTAVTVPVAVSVTTDILGQVNGINFTKVFGGANPLPQTLTIPSTGASLTYSISSSTATGGNWLTATPAGYLTTPSSITATVNASPTLAVGTYTGQIVITPYGDEGPPIAMTIAVTLTVAPAAGATYFDNVPGQMSFSLITNAPNNPPAQLIQIRNAGTGTLSWTLNASTADGGNWLTASITSGTAPSTVSVSIQKGSLPGSGLIAGTFVGELVFQTAGSTVTVPVSVWVGTSVFAQVNPINFVMLAGGPNPLPQILTIASTGADITYSVTSSTASGGSWLTAGPAGYLATNSSVTATVNASPTLAAGTYTGQIVLTQYGDEGASMTIPVTLTVAAAGSTFFDNVQGQASFFIKTAGGNPASQSVQIRNPGTGILNWNVAAITADGGNWLTTSATSGTAPATVSIGVVTSALPSQGLIAGVFVGELIFTGAGETVTIPVAVQVGTNIFVEPAPLTFSRGFGGSNPLSQMAALTGTGTALTFSLSTSTGNGGAWLSVGPAGYLSTPANATAMVVASPTLAAGSYTAQIVLNPYGDQGVAMTIPVYLNVTGASLAVAKNHNGNFAQGQQGATYTVIVSNNSGGPATSGQIAVTENLPSGLTLVSMTGNAPWNCVTNTCTRSDALTPGNSYPPITVTVNVAASATSPQVNQVSVSGGGSSGANASDSTTITQSTGHPSFFNGEVSVGGGVYYLAFPDANVFGYYNYADYPPIIFSYSLGFEGVIDGGNGQIYLYDFTSSHWWYTSAGLFPYLYDFTLNNWLFYFTNSTTPRYFSDLTTGKIITE